MSLIAIPRSTLKSVVAGILGIDCVFAEEPKPFVSPVTQAQATLTVHPGKTVGVDELRYTFSATPSPGTLTETQEGLRSFVLSVLVEAFAQSTAFADDYLETLRTRLRRESQRQLLLAQNMALATFEAIQRLPTSYDNRVVSAASLDIHIAWAFADSTDLNPATGWIETVNGSNQTPGTSPTITGDFTPFE